jgi:homoserine kinase type II
MNDVYLLWYVREVNGADDELLIGVYRAEADARAAIGRLRGKPGFSTFPDGFQVRPYELNRDHWIEGFVVDAA